MAENSAKLHGRTSADDFMRRALRHRDGQSFRADRRTAAGSDSWQRRLWPAIALALSIVAHAGEPADCAVTLGGDTPGSPRRGTPFASSNALAVTVSTTPGSPRPRSSTTSAPGAASNSTTSCWWATPRAGCQATAATHGSQKRSTICIATFAFVPADASAPTRGRHRAPAQRRLGSSITAQPIDSRSWLSLQ